MSTAERAPWNTQPWQPKPGIRCNPVARKPHRKQVAGCDTGAGSVSSLIAQESVPGTEANAWLHLGSAGAGEHSRHHEYSARIANGMDASRPFFAEPVREVRPKSLREALERKAAGVSADDKVAGTTTYHKHLRSAEARHQREVRRQSHQAARRVGKG